MESTQKSHERPFFSIIREEKGALVGWIILSFNILVTRMSLFVYGHMDVGA